MSSHHQLQILPPSYCQSRGTVQPGHIDPSQGNQGVDVNRKSKQTGQTALHCIVACMELDQRKPLVKLLIKHGANPLRSDFNGRSALDVARERQLYGEVQYLEGVIEEREFQADAEDERARLHRTSSVPVSRTGSAGGSAEWLGGPSASFEVRERETKRTERTLSLPEDAQIPAQAAEARDRPAGRAQTASGPLTTAAASILLVFGRASERDSERKRQKSSQKDSPSATEREKKLLEKGKAEVQKIITCLVVSSEDAKTVGIIREDKYMISFTAGRGRNGGSTPVPLRFRDEIMSFAKITLEARAQQLKEEEAVLGD
uniref:Uncharacterized protein n=1 Tax=Chromera velia CCMP2878 TaxID=1169474 RepID=A0A0G4HS45_9ALVE|eukprot:Cvel_8206.t1-p1 / transcript=Cvel_8206.t1 / gene=Cvel_8206 / organism=Chromera_velia_CCMP2878 / gene_product=hypothetical protein / transcript_product=hypothetical protein / location=Cvel_scaffold447:56561-62943(+) / protein_length=316 / sequence_SO=supercontig / SO=protein_coding / is_pseudo=false